MRFQTSAPIAVGRSAISQALVFLSHCPASGGTESGWLIALWRESFIKKARRSQRQGIVRAN
jgi:hypothetical protein